MYKDYFMVVVDGKLIAFSRTDENGKYFLCSIEKAKQTENLINFFNDVNSNYVFRFVYRNRHTNLITY